MRLPSYDAGFWRTFARWGATEMPRWWLRWSPTPIGLGIGLARPETRAQLEANLRLVHGRRTALEERLDVATTLSTFAHCLAEGLASTADRPPPFRYTVEGEEHLVRVRASQHGSIFVTAHTGSWDVAGGISTLQGLDLAIAMAPERDRAARAVSDAGRARNGVKVFHVGDDPLAALPLARHVREGGAIALQIDRVPPGMRAHPARLFGRPWAVPLGPFQLALATGAPILPVFTARLGFLHYLMHADPPIHVDRRAGLDVAIGRAMGAMETFIRRFPTQWFHFADHPPIDLVAARPARAAKAS